MKRYLRQIFSRVVSLAILPISPRLIEEWQTLITYEEAK